MPARTATLHQTIRDRAKAWLGWGTGSQATPPKRGIRRWIGDVVMHNTLDMALRYMPIVDYLKPRFDARTSFVEVGSGSAGITPYLKRPVIGVDHNFDGPTSDWLLRCFGSVVALPFADQSVDVVLCVDTIEHVPPTLRARAVAELLRISRRLTIIAVPCGRLSAQRDRDLSIVLRRRLSRHDRFVDEHLEHGLPEVDEINSWVVGSAAQLGRTVRVSNRDNVSLRVWWLVQMAKVSLLWRGLLMLSFPVTFRVLRRFNRRPSYRQIFFIEGDQIGAA